MWLKPLEETEPTLPSRTWKFTPVSSRGKALVWWLLYYFLYWLGACNRLQSTFCNSVGSFAFKLTVIIVIPTLHFGYQSGSRLHVQHCQLTPHEAQASNIGNNSFTQWILLIVENPPMGAKTIESSIVPHNPLGLMHHSRFVTSGLLVSMLLSNETPFKPTRTQHHHLISAWLWQFMQIK